MSGSIEKVLQYFGNGGDACMPEELSDVAREQTQNAIRRTMELNTVYHTPEEIVDIMSEITGEQLDNSFRLFPSFYTDFGRCLPGLLKA